MGKSEPEGLVMREVKRAQNAIPLGSYATAVSGHPRSSVPSEPPSRTYLEPEITQPEPAHHRGALPHPPSSSSRPAKGYSDSEKPGRSAQVADGAESLAARRSHTRRERKVEPPRKAAKDEEEEEDEIVDDSEEDRHGSEGGMDVDQPAKVINARVARSTKPPPRPKDAADSLPSPTSSSTSSSSRSPTPITRDAARSAVHTRAYPPRPTSPTLPAPPPTDDTLIDAPDPLTSDAIAKDKAARKEAKHRKLVVEK
ncbi:hypothetical protein RQP46_001393 [Phenoliferia psychrophenolica]